MATKPSLNILIFVSNNLGPLQVDWRYQLSAGFLNGTNAMMTAWT